MVRIMRVMVISFQMSQSVLWVTEKMKINLEVWNIIRNFAAN